MYEKLLLDRFQKIQEKEKTDPTSSCPHGFKKNFSTETACFKIKTKLSSARPGHQFQRTSCHHLPSKRTNQR